MHQGRIIKWDGEVPKVWKFRKQFPWVYRDIPDDPAKHPQCAEIVEFGEGRAPRVTFRRSSNVTD